MGAATGALPSAMAEIFTTSLPVKASVPASAPLADST